MFRFASTLVAFLVLPLVALAQAPPFLPRQCEADAVRAARQGMPDAQVIAISTIALSLPVGPISLSIGFSTTDGRSGLWAYSLYSPSQDTSTIVPMTRLLSCSDVTSLVPGGLDGGEFELESVVPIPANYLQGQALITALETNSTYRAYRQTFPDSIPRIVSLSTSPDEFGPYPAGTPFWALFFVGETTPENMTCFVHATDGVVECLAAPDNVNDDKIHSAAPRVTVAPNPTSDAAMISIPDACLGQRVDVVVIDATGRHVSSFSTIASVPALLLPTQQLASGAYTVSLSSRNGMARTILSVIR